MKKKIQCVLFLLMLLSVVSVASAAEKRANQRRYDLSFPVLQPIAMPDVWQTMIPTRS